MVEAFPRSARQEVDEPIILHHQLANFGVTDGP